MLALVNGKPEQLNLKQALVCFVDHRLDVIQRRARFELERSEDRAHVLEGLLTALADIDRVIDLIRSSATPQIAAETLQAELDLSERQAEAILAMVDEGILEPSGEDSSRWRFPASSILQARRVVRLQEDLGVNLTGAALVLDLLERIESLETQLRTLEARRGRGDT